MLLCWIVDAEKHNYRIKKNASVCPKHTAIISLHKGDTPVDMGSGPTRMYF
jgi:hypothetical protein